MVRGGGYFVLSSDDHYRLAVAVVVGASPTNHLSLTLFKRTSILLGIYSTIVMSSPVPTTAVEGWGGWVGGWVGEGGGGMMKYF